MQYVVIGKIPSDGSILDASWEHYFVLHIFFLNLCVWKYLFMVKACCATCEW